MTSANDLIAPMRGHAWRTNAGSAIGIEERNADAKAEDPAALIEKNAPAYLRYAPAEGLPFESIALGFDDDGLARILYPVHFPAREGQPEKPLDAIPEKYSTVREWLLEHFGEPAKFSANLEREAYFEDFDLLVNEPSYRIVYSWCTESANAYLSAQRLEGTAPVILCEIESPDLPPNPRYARIGHGCGDGTGS